MKSKRLLDIMGEIDDRHIEEAAPATEKSRKKPAWIKWGTVAACFVLLISACFGTFAVVAEVEEYKAAAQFFNDYGMSTDGLTRGEIKKIYRDITTKTFTYSKTAEVILNSISADNVGGYDIMQDDPTPEDIENLWNYKNYIGGLIINPPQTGIHYKYRTEYKTDEALGSLVQDRSYIEKYNDDELLWSVSISEFCIQGYSVVSDGVIAYGDSRALPGSQLSAWIAKIDADGNLMWKKMLNNGFNIEYISTVIENDDGSCAVFSRGDGTNFCLTQYTSDGKEISSHKANIGGYAISNAARFGDGYIVHLTGSTNNQIMNKFLKVDREGNITDSFYYDNEGFRYSFIDMIEFNGNIYLSAYAVPGDDDGSYELADVLQYLLDNNVMEITSEELTPMIRDNYTALLLVCDPKTGKPREFYSVKGSLGGKLSISDTGNLLWDVESITSTFFSPATSSFMFGGTSYVFRYTFDASGLLVNQEKTGQVVNFRR